MADRCGLAAAFDFDDIFVVGGNLGLVDVAVLNLERCRLLVVCGLEIRAGTGANQLAAQSRGMSCLLPGARTCRVTGLPPASLGSERKSSDLSGDQQGRDLTQRQVNRPFHRRGLVQPTPFQVFPTLPILGIPAISIALRSYSAERISAGFLPNHASAPQVVLPVNHSSDAREAKTDRWGDCDAVVSCDSSTANPPIRPLRHLQRATTAIRSGLSLSPRRQLKGTAKMSEPHMHTPSPQPDLNRNRLPTLFEVLSRRTLPPVDLFSFYIYMRDQQRSVDYLDFWCVMAGPARGTLR